MLSPIRSPRKRRTREHIIADLSVHHVEGIILESGFVAQRTSSDYGYDLIMWTFDEYGFVEPGAIYFQFKASDRLQPVGSNVIYDVDIRDYNLWKHEEIPVVLVMYDALRKEAYWLAIQQYLNEKTARQPKKGAKTVRLQIPCSQIVDRTAIETIRNLKSHAQGLKWRVIS